jgi:Ni/Co efflux regulator RcnB
MKRLLTAAAALSLLAGSAAMAEPNHNDHGQNAGDQRGHDQRGNDQRGDNRGANNENRFDQRDNGHDRGNHYGHDRRWSRGERLPPQYYGNPGYYVDYRAHNLRYPPRGYRWVQVDNNYMLASTATGLIAQIISGR